MSDSISRLTNTLSLRFTQHSSPNRSISPNIPLTQRQSARRHYEQFTNCSKEEMKRLVKMDQTMRRANWRHDHIKANNTFSVFEKKGLDHFPHNNDKYNVQFLQRSLYGKNYASPAKKIGCFQPPKDRLYSHHYRPIVRSKRSYNQDYQLRTSIFGQTWVDSKRDKILDEYKLQANPFRTPVSNALISTMRQDRRHYHKL